MTSTPPDPGAQLGARSAEAFFATCIALIAIYFGLPYYLEHLAGQALVDVDARSALTACKPPIEPEQLHIIIVPRDGKLSAECMYVGSRGTYSRRAR